MKRWVTNGMLALAVLAAQAHEGHETEPRSGVPAESAQQVNTEPAFMIAQVPPNAVAAPAIARSFNMFAPYVRTRWDESYLYVESDGLPTHGMMVGITAWQQQVPLPQSYRGDNAWRIPLLPVAAAQPATIKGHFLRGAIALAANGVPIFNPQNNRGEIAQEIGELDQWGGHCGRADDYHYHVVPLHLERVVGKGLPVAFALDGYPIFGLNEPDGSPVGDLDECHGHRDASGYHYHAATNYPYVFAAFRGRVVEADGQVDPQPRAQPVRPAAPPLRGAKIISFQSTSGVSRLGYEVRGETRAIVYRVQPDQTVAFEFQNGSEGTNRQTYARSSHGGRARPPDDRRPGPPEDGAPMRRPPAPGGARR